MKAILRDPKKIVPVCIAALFFLTVFMNNSPYFVKVVLYPVYREIKKEMIILDSKDFYTAETANYNIYYKDIKSECMDMIISSAEKSFNEVVKDFDYTVDAKINIVVYHEYKEMANKIGLGNGSNAMGAYYGGIISVHDPSKWLKDTERTIELFNREGPMVHELTHYVIDHMSSGNVPVWFTEGAALYEEYRINGVEWGSNKKYKEYYKIEDLEGDFYKLDEIKAYKQSFIIVKYIGDNFGMKGINDIIKELRSGKTMDQAIKSVTNTGLRELLEEVCNISL